MKYSVRGSLNVVDTEEIITLINTFNLWRLVTGTEENFNFEVWLNTKEDKDSLFNGLKPFVKGKEHIDWHECRHDGNGGVPCTIAETYTGDGS